MSKTTAPLLSFGASGQIGSTLVYATWKGRPYARRYVIPANPNSTAQQETRNTFTFLNNVWKYMPGAVLDGWNAYAAIQRFTNRNGWLKQNVSALRSQANLNNLVMSPSASGGLAASSITLTAGANQITVDLTEPSLPTGWTTTKAYAAAIADQDPQSGVLYDVTAGTDAAAPWSIVLAGLTSAQLYQVGGWFQFTKDDGTFAYGVAISDTATPT